MYKTFVLFFAFCLLCAVPSFGHGSFVYVTNYGDGTISQYRVMRNGSLTPLNPPTVKAHILCHSLAVARGQYLYATSARDWSKRHCVVSQFRIGYDGRLRLLSPGQVLLPDTPTTIAIEPSGRFAYVSNRECTVTLLRMGEGGRLVLLSPPVMKVADAGGVTPIMNFDKLHHILYGSYDVGIMDMVIGGMFACMIGHNGHLNLLPLQGKFYNTGYSRTVSPPYSLSLSPNGRYAYITESIRDMRLAAQWRDVVAQYWTCPGGVLKPHSPKTVPVEPMETAGASFIGSKGRFLYLIYEKTDTTDVTAHWRIAYASIGRIGKLGRFAYQTLNIVAPLPAVQPFSLAFDHTGRFCYFVEGNYLYAFRVQINGALSPLHHSRIDAGYGPLGVVCVQR